MTPIDPVMVPGLDTMASAATPTYTPPDAEMLPKLATTLQPWSRNLSSAAWISWLSPTVPPGLSIRSSRAGNSRS